MIKQYPGVECVVDCKLMLGERPLWDELAGCLWWLDVPPTSRLFRLKPETNAIEEWAMPEMITSLSTRQNGQGLLVASHRGINTFDPVSGQLEHVLNPEPTKPLNRCNDGATDCNGNFWFGTMQNNIAPNGDPLEIISRSGSLFRLSPNYELTEFEENIGISNTACWSPGNDVFYSCDSLAGKIFAYDFDKTVARISNKRVFAEIDRGVPDGSAMDTEGFLWNARWGGGCIARFAPDGTLDRCIDIPCENVTSCTFGGDNFETLYVTTARYELSAKSLLENPLSGGLFSVDTGVRGLKANRFAG